MLNSYSLRAGGQSEYRVEDKAGKFIDLLFNRLSAHGSEQSLPRIQR